LAAVYHFNTYKEYIKYFPIFFTNTNISALDILTLVFLMHPLNLGGDFNISIFNAPFKPRRGIAAHS